MCVQSLSVFNVSKVVEDGVEITPKVELVGEIIWLEPYFTL